MAGMSFEEKVADVLAYKRSNTYPEGMNKTDRHNLCRFSANFSLEEGTLFYSAKGRKVVVVHTMNQALQLFKQHHDSPQGGHRGKDKTRIALTSRYYWPEMTKDITGWVEQCLHCQKAGKELNPDTTLKNIKVSQPWELVGMDLIGTATKKGYQYIVIATDYFTRWVDAFPLRTKSAYEVAKKIYNIIIQYGFVQRILTDRDPEFNNEFNLEMCKIWGIERIFTSPCHPLTNGFAHSSIKSIKRALQKLVDTGSNWDEFLGDVLFSLRSQVNMTTKMSPFRLLYGFEARFPDQLSDNYTLPNLEELDEQFYKEHSVNLKLRKDADAALALSNSAKAREKQQNRPAKRESSKSGEITFEVGDSVMILNTRRKTRTGGLPQPTYHSPYRVTAVVGKRVKLETISGKLLGSKYSISHLKPLQEPPALEVEKRSEENTEMEIAVDEIGNMGANISREPPESQVINVELTDVAEEECVVEEVASSDVGDMLVEDGEDREWLLKVNFVQTHKVTQRLEAKVREIHLYDTSFYGLKPRSCLGVEVVDAYLRCVAEKASGKVQAVSSAIATSILSGRARQMKLEKLNVHTLSRPTGAKQIFIKSGIMQSDLLLLPFNAPKHWVLVVQCDSCERWAHMPCLPEEINEENLTDEEKKYSCTKCA